MQTAAFAERDELLYDRAELLGLRQRGGDLLVLDQRGAHVGEHGLAMLGLLVELAMNFAVTHRLFPLTRNDPGPAPGTRLSNDPRSAWPALRCSPAASPALPCRDGDPSEPALL